MVHGVAKSWTWLTEHIHSVVQISRAYSSIEENYLSVIKAISDELTASNMLKGEKVKIFPVKTRNKADISTFTISILHSTRSPGQIS